MSGPELFKHGRECMEACWHAGQKRPLTTKEFGELRVAREEWQKRKARLVLAQRRHHAEILGKPGAREI